MLEFIFVPVIFGIVTLGIYKIFELFVRRKERLLMIEKFGQSSEGLDLSQSILFPGKQNISFVSLKAACLLLGLGLGLLVGFFIISYWQTHIPMENRMAYHVRETANIIYGASVLLFGGLGLLVAFFLEQRYIQKEKNHNS
jgi:hypothetical protein